MSRRADLAMWAASLALAVWVTGDLWLAPNGRAILVNSGDQALFEWLLAYGGHALRTGQDPLFTHLLNMPDGVNLAVNTSITVYAVAFAPLTWLLGPSVTFLVILTLNLAATAYAWYWLLTRKLGTSPLGAAVGGLFCGFAPGLVSHANAHLNWTAQWLVPLVVWRVLELRKPGRAVRDGVVLGVLVAVMFSIAAEALFFTALASGLFVAGWALSRRAEARAAVGPFLRGLGVTALVAAGLLAYPLWLHFAGPQRYSGIGFDQLVHSEDAAAYGAYPERSLAGWLGLGTRLAPNPTEETTFFGLPLLVLAIACFVALYRAGAGDRAGDLAHRAGTGDPASDGDLAHRATLRALAGTGLAFAVLSLGPRLKWFGDITPLPLPFAVLSGLPVFNAALPARLGLMLIPVIGILLAWTVDLVRGPPASFTRDDEPRHPAAPARARWMWAAAPGRTRWAWAAVFAVALLPLTPTPLLTVHRDPVPEFFTTGQWRSYVTEGGTIVPVPLPSDLLPDGQRWQTTALAQGEGEFSVPAGFFLGPGGPDGRGRIGPIPRPTEQLLFDAARAGLAPVVTDADRERAAEDLRYWRAEIVVLADQVHGAKWTVHYAALRVTATALFGPPERVADVWLWRVPRTALP